MLQMSGAGSRYRSTRGGPRKFRSDCEEVRHTCSVGVCSQFPKSDDNIIFYVPGQVTSGARAKGLNVLYTAHETNRGQQQGPPCPTLQVRAAAAAAVHSSGRAPALRPRDTHHACVRAWLGRRPPTKCMQIQGSGSSARESRTMAAWMWHDAATQRLSAGSRHLPLRYADRVCAAKRTETAPCPSVRPSVGRSQGQRARQQQSVDVKKRFLPFLLFRSRFFTFLTFFYFPKVFF